MCILHFKECLLALFVRESTTLVVSKYQVYLILLYKHIWALTKPFRVCKNDKPLDCPLSIDTESTVTDYYIISLKFDTLPKIDNYCQGGTPSL